MTNKKVKARKGFTIIEVVLVLAIAGLIFLMVFVALPSLQRSQRDTQRREDMSRVSTSVLNYMTNNNNNLPGAGTWDADSVNGEYPSNCSSITACRFIRDYMNTANTDGDTAVDTFEDPDNYLYNLVITENMRTNKGEIVYTKIADQNGDLDGSAEDGYTISGDGAYNDHIIYMVPGGVCDGEFVKIGDRRDYAIVYRLEGSGVYCLDSQ